MTLNKYGLSWHFWRLTILRSRRRVRIKRLIRQRCSDLYRLLDSMEEAK